MKLHNSAYNHLHTFECAMCNVKHKFNDYWDCFVDEKFVTVVKHDKLEIYILRCKNCDGVAATYIEDDGIGAALYTGDKSEN